MRLRRSLETAAATAFAAWRRATTSDSVWLDWALLAAAFWVFWIWTPPGSRRRTPLMLGVMVALLGLYIRSHIPFLLDVFLLYAP